MMNGMCGTKVIPPFQGGLVFVIRIPSPLGWVEECRAVGAE